MSFGAGESLSSYEVQRARPEVASPATAGPAATPAEELFAKVKDLLERMDTARTDAEVADYLQVAKGQAKSWLERLAKEGILQKLSKPTRYRSVKSADGERE